jgi:hypothetical protein
MKPSIYESIYHETFTRIDFEIFTFFTETQIPKPMSLLNGTAKESKMELPVSGFCAQACPSLWHALLLAPLPSSHPSSFWCLTLASARCQSSVLSGRLPVLRHSIYPTVC